MKVLVTGGAGFVGSHVVDQLIDRNFETYVLVSGFRSNKHPSIINKEAHVVHGDLRDYDSLLKATEKMDYVMHLAAVLSHYIEKNPDFTIDVNIKGTWNLRKACVQNKVERIVFASSSFVYGEPLTCPINELHPSNPKEILGVTKVTGEKILQITHPESLPYTILRLFNVYGPRQYPDGIYTSVFTTWISKALKKEPLEIHADGKQRLDLIYVKDVAEAFVSCLHMDARNEIFNVGSGIATSMNDLAKNINEITNNPTPSYYNPNHAAYLKLIQADICKIKSRIAWTPKTQLINGLKETVEFYRGDA